MRSPVHTGDSRPYRQQSTLSPVCTGLIGDVAAMSCWQLERHRSLDGDEPERVQSGSSSGDERVVGRGHQSRADSAPRRRRVLPDVDVATADSQPVSTTARPGKFDEQYTNCIVHQ